MYELTVHVQLFKTDNQFLYVMFGVHRGVTHDCNLVIAVYVCFECDPIVCAY